MAIAARASSVDLTSAREVAPPVQLDFKAIRDYLREAPIEQFASQAKAYEGFINGLTPEAKRVFKDHATASHTMPCNVLHRSQAIFKGLENGSIRYDGINSETNEIKLRYAGTEQSAGKISGHHISAMVQFYGADKTESVLRASFEREGRDKANEGLTMVQANLIMAEGAKRIVESDLSTPTLRTHMPIAPATWKCNFQGMT